MNRLPAVVVTLDDARLLHALGTLCEHLPAEKQAGHLAPRCAAFAARIEAVCPRAAAAQPLEDE